MRMVSSESEVDAQRLRTGLYTEAQERAIMSSIGSLSDLPIYIDDSPLQGIVEMRSKARRLSQERGLDLLVVDYIQIIQQGIGRGDNRAQEMSEITRSIKGLARDLNVPVLAVSQLNRAIESRASHKPQLSDLRESGSIEQDADVVMFIYREDLQVSENDWVPKYPGQAYPKNVAELIVLKHRHGPTDTVELLFRDNLVRFESAPFLPEAF